MNPVIRAIEWLSDPNRSLEGYDQLKLLASALSISPEECLAIPNDRRLCYRPFTIKKKSGQQRRILAPSERLKQLQRRILQNVLHDVEIHPAAKAFRKGHSVASHAQTHLNQQIILTVDLRDFFGSTTTARVRKFWEHNAWRGEALKVLLRLTTFAGALPQGAPTSPALSNAVNFTLDARLQELTAMHGGRYSRYCDDLAFSWATDSVPASFVASATGMLDSYGYEVQTDKGWRLQRCADGAELPGVVIRANRLWPADAILKRVRLLRWGIVRSKSARARLAGYLGYMKMLRPKSRRR